MEILKYSEIDLAETIKRSEQDVNNVLDTVSEILNNVKDNGDEAVKSYTEKFDGVSVGDLKVTESEIKEAYDTLDDSLLAALKQAAANIEKFHKKQIPEEWEMMESEGIMLITNNGDEIGYAALLGKNRKVQDTHAFFNILAPDQTCTIEREVIDDVLQIDASYFFRAEMEGKSLNRSLYCIYLYDDYDYQFILALNENCYEYSSICDIAEAIIYSFTLLEK